MSTAPIHAAIIGASGYTGAELIRLLYRHPYVKITALAAEKSAGQPIEAIYPHLAGFGLPPVVAVQAIPWHNVHVAFGALPHGASQAVLASLPDHLKIIDLSADFRLSDLESYALWYGHAHQAPELQKEAVYGLSEIYRDRIRQARLAACPGCYPTTAALPLFPLLEKGLVHADDIIIDSKSGISGAGRSAKQENLFCEINDGVRDYGICRHRHIPEIEQTLSDAANRPVQVHFTPQVVPMSRGMLSNIYVKPTEGQNADTVRQALAEYYRQEPFVRIAPEGHAPSTREVYSTNHCVIGVFPGRTAGRLVLVSVIDNLVKGASGQAVQNMNLMFGFPETAGLDELGVFP